MALTILWTRSAQIDRVGVYSYWNERTKSKDYSRRLDELIRHRISLLKQYPTSGLVTDLPDVRFHIIAHHYKLFYKIEAQTAIILRFWDTRQDPDKLNLNR